MTDYQSSIAVKILGQDYKVKCPPDKIADLQESAYYLDKLMQEIRDGGHVLSLDRIAVVAALNVTHEMLTLKKQKNSYIDLLNKRIVDLQQKIDRALVSEAA